MATRKNVAVSDETPEDETTETKSRAGAPTKRFQVVDELPAKAKRGAPEGFGVSKWVGILKDFVEQCPSGQWVLLLEYETKQGATTAKRELGKKLEGDSSPAPEGVVLELASRPVGDGHSGLFAKYTA